MSYSQLQYNPKAIKGFQPNTKLQIIKATKGKGAFKGASVILMTSQKKLWKQEGSEWHLILKGLMEGGGNPIKNFMT